MKIEYNENRMKIGTENLLPESGSNPWNPDSWQTCKDIPIFPLIGDILNLASQDRS